MANMKGKGVVLAGLVAGAASFLSKKENRDMLNDMLNGAKQKAGNAVEEQKSNFRSATQNVENSTESAVQSAHGAAETVADKATEVINGNEMVSEGAQEVINEFNKNKNNF